MVVISHSPLVKAVRVDSNNFEFEFAHYRASLRDCKLNSHGEWSGELEISSPAGRVVWTRVVFTSIRSRKEVAREFRIRTRDKQYDIERALETALLYAQRELTSLQKVDWQAGAEHDARYLVYPVLPDRVVSVLAGDGGAGKGYFALLMSSLVASGCSAAGFTPNANGSVVYLDYESNENDFSQRVSRIANGLRVAEMRIRYLRADAPYTLLHTAVQREVRDIEARLLVLDSLAPAVGQMSDAAAAIETIRKLRELDCAVLCIAHVAKNQPKAKEITPYGSVFVKNLARNVWMLQRDSSTSDTLNLTLKHLKSNFAALAEPIELRVNFYDDAIVFHRAGERETHDALAEQLLEALDEPRTAQELAALLSVSQFKVSRVLNELARAGKVNPHGRGVRGEPKRYKRADADAPAPTPAQTQTNSSDEELLATLWMRARAVIGDMNLYRTLLKARYNNQRTSELNTEELRDLSEVIEQLARGTEIQQYLQGGGCR